MHISNISGVFMNHYPSTRYDTINTELKSLLDEYRTSRSFDAKRYINDKSEKLNEYMRTSGLSSCIVGVSGGIDSAIVLGIAANAMEFHNSPIKRILPVTLPCHDRGATNQSESVEKAKSLCDTLKLPLYEIDITTSTHIYSSLVEDSIGIAGDDWAKGQLVAYSRTPILYYITSLMSEANTPGIILGTNNKDEGAYLGYFGKASDGMVDVQLISDIHKSEVYSVARELNVPECILGAIPAGDMYDGRDDVDVFGAPYDFVELYLGYLEGKVNIDNLSSVGKYEFTLLSLNIEKLHQYNSHKYIACSPSVHLDLKEYTYSIPNGWTYNNWLGDEE